MSSGGGKPGGESDAGGWGGRRTGHGDGGVVGVFKMGEEVVCKME